MKQANFTYKETRQGKPGATIYGTVTLNGDKTSISLLNASHYSASTRYGAKNLANAIVAANFDHPAVTHLKTWEDNSKLLTAIFDKTTEFKADYIIKTKAFATRAFANMTEWNNSTDIQWFERFGIKYEMKAGYGANKDHQYPTPVSGTYNGRSYYKMRNEREEFAKIVKAGYEAYETKEVATAERHFKYSIEKLGRILNDKGVTDETEFTITSGYVGVNFECVINHAGGITRAWTIIAEGPIVRPHYRYLIK